MYNRSIISVLFLATLAFSAPSSSAQTAADLAKLKARIDKITAEVNQDKVKQGTARAELSRVDTELADANRNLEKTRRKIRTSSADVKRVEARTATLRAEIAKSRDQLRRLVLASYISGRAEFFKLLLNDEDPGRLGRNLAYYRYISQARARDIHAVEAMLTELNQLEHEHNVRYGELRDLETAKLLQLDKLESTRVVRAQLLSKLEQRIGTRQLELDELRENAARLERLLGGLGSSLAKDLTGTSENPTFHGMRGRLSLPVRGSISAPFGQFNEDTGTRSRGIFVRAEEGTTVYSIYSGRVAFADWLRGFGLLLILDHGGGYMSLYSHNKMLYKEVGEWVEQNEPVAQVGVSGGLADAGLYFEVRRDGEPRNPLIWCKVN